MLRLALLLLATTPATALAQAYVPAGYELAAPTVPEGSPAQIVRLASAAHAAGDRREAATLLRAASRTHPDDTSIRLARAALGARLDPALALRLHERGRRDALADLDSIHGARTFAIALGGISAATGVVSLVLLVVGLVGNWDCGTVLGVIPTCGRTSENGGLLTASAAIGAGALALALTSGITLAVSGSREGAWQRRLASHAALTVELTPEGGYAALSGRF